MCQNLFKERIVQIVVEIIILFVFFSTIASSERPSFHQFFTFQALETLIFQTLDFFVC